ncbi:MAG: VCBS repeat-containing protein [Planctomycetes bacterium]|nr:VCBS repeat-containing protein [Planctomycetota bacterium]
MTQSAWTGVFISLFVLLLSRANAQGIFKDDCVLLSNSPAGMVVADFNQDGAPDSAVTLVTSTPTGSIAILLNQLNGQPFDVKYISVSTGPGPIAVADMNQDGKLDILCAGGQSGAFTVFLGNGLGGFPQGASYPIILGNTSSITAADLNLDGFIDVVTTHLQASTQDISIAFANNTGAFTSSTKLFAGYYPSDAATGDLNHDGLPDLVVTNKYQSVGFVPSPSSGPLPYIAAKTAQVSLASSPGVFPPFFVVITELGPSNVRILDANFDGNEDLVVGCSYSGYSVFFWRGPNIYLISAIPNHILTIALGNGQGQFPTIINSNSGASPDCLDLGDYNADGKADFIAANPLTYLATGGCTLTIGDGNGGAVNPVFVDSLIESVCARAADFDGDGKQDVVFAESNIDRVGIKRGNGLGGFFTAFQSFAAPSSCYISKLVDINGDGKLDDVCANASKVTILNGDGVGGFLFTSDFSVFTSAGIGDVAVADLNLDGVLDMIIPANDKKIVNIYHGGAGGTFQLSQTIQPHQNLSTSAGAETHVSDLNGDGSPDFVIARKATEIYINNGVGAFAQGASLPASTATTPLKIDVGDINNDGVADIINFLTSYYIGNGNGTFLPPQVVDPAVAYPQSITLVDLNGDAQFDLLLMSAQNVDPIQLFVYYNTGLGLAGPPVKIPAVTYGISSLLCVDLNRDGSNDAMIGFPGAHVIAPFLNDGSGSITFPSIISTPLVTDYPALGDLDSDGRVDAAFFGSSTIYSLMNIQTIYSGTSPIGTATPGCFGVMGVSVASLPTVGNSLFGVYVTNAPRGAAGAAILGDVSNPNGADFFFVNLLLYVDPFASSGLAACPLNCNRFGQGFLPIAIPNDPNLHGIVRYIEFIFLEDASIGENCGAGDSQLVSSRALSITVQ